MTTTTVVDLVNRILEGHAVDQINRLPDACIDLTATSPPYFGLRTYLDESNPYELGREVWMKDYLRNLTDVFKALWPKLKDTGSVFVVIGDTYNGDKHGTTNGLAEQHSSIGRQKKGAVDANVRINKIRQPEVEPKSLLSIPQRFKLEMTDKLRYVCRNEIIWDKPNAMPNSAPDRWGSSHEYIFFFTKKSGGYFLETPYEPFRTGSDLIENIIKDPSRKHGFGGPNKRLGYKNDTYSGKPWRPKVTSNGGGRIARDVWHVNTQGRSDAHFATFPDEIVRRIIKVACPEYTDNTKTHPGLVLDPFCGRGTTCIIARQLGRDFIGIDLNPAFCELARKNLSGPPPSPVKQTDDPNTTKRKNTSILDFIGGVMEQ